MTPLLWYWLWYRRWTPYIARPWFPPLAFPVQVLLSRPLFMSREVEIRFLEEEKRYLQSLIEQIDRRLKELKKESE